jgi:ribonucleoside-diphosphate reductase alpha chain
MQTEQTNLQAASSVPQSASTELAVESRIEIPNQYEVIRRNGKMTNFDVSKIQIAVIKAFLAVEGGQAAASRRIHDVVEELTRDVVTALFRRRPDGGTLHIEEIQDQVELALMRNGHHKVARAYVLYREERAQQRAADSPEEESQAPTLQVTNSDGSKTALDTTQLEQIIADACAGLDGVDRDAVMKEAMSNFYDGIPAADGGSAMMLGARVLIEQDPNYSFVAAHLLLHSLRGELLALLTESGFQPQAVEPEELYQEVFADSIRYAIELQLLDPELGHFDLERLSKALQPERDRQFTYLGLQTLYDRYFLHSNERRMELPQCFFMRVAMGLAINEVDREQRAIEFYDLLSSFDFMSSTPTLFNSGTLRPQLSSCYLTTVPDDLDGIYGAIRDNALLSKFAGGLGNDWTRVRGLGAHIKSTNGKSQGVVPFLKVANDTAVAVNQGGKRKGAVCAYLETWHIDIEEFLDLRKNTGDERRRTHDMNTANWIPDLFMQRVTEEGEWTLFSPDEVPELHDLTGQEFREKYEEYEALADQGEIRVWKRLPALTLWRKMLGQLFETGHPWITFKDACNLRYTNQHMGVVHSSNLCTEITLHSNDREIAVCNLGSVNLAAHVNADGLDLEKLERTVSTAMRMLDNVIDYNYYSVPQARNSNLRHRPVGLGMMGFQDALYKQDVAYGSEQAVEFADRSMEALSYFAIRASTDLAEERGCYSSYYGSLWSKGILPKDSLELLREGRGGFLDLDESSTLDWNGLREQVTSKGMRNSNCLAIAPTATISNICGVSQSIEPAYQNLFVKSNLSGEFTVVNPSLVLELKEQGMWDAVMVNDLKYFDGSVAAIDRIPPELKQKYACAFEIDSRWLIEAAARRQKWIDQAQSLNLYLAEPSGAMLDNLFKLAWVRGLKTTYYLRTLGATHVEKTAVDSPQAEDASPKACSILDPECEACQ